MIDYCSQILYIHNFEDVKGRQQVEHICAIRIITVLISEELDTFSVPVLYVHYLT